MFRTILIGGEPARRAAFKIGEFDYLTDKPFSVVGFVNPGTSENFSLVNCGHKWYDLPVYRNVQLAMSNVQFDSVGIYFNAKHVLYWVQEVVKCKGIKNIVIFAEDVPEKDQREIVALADKHKINIVGPSSTGMVVAGQGRLGEIGGEFRNLQLCRLDQPGDAGLITKSGTMAGELMWVVSQNLPAGGRQVHGLHTAVQIGGDSFPATDFVWWLEKFSQNPEIKTVVLAGEAGGDLEERAAQWFQSYQSAKSQFPKFKLIAVISGLFLEQMPKGQKFGHAGAKQEESGFGSAKHKIEVLRNAGVEVVEFELLGKRLSELNPN